MFLAHKMVWKPLALSLAGLTGGVFLLGSAALTTSRLTPAPQTVVPYLAELEVGFLGLPLSAEFTVDGKPVPTQVQLARFRVVGQPPALEEGWHVATADIRTALRHFHQEWKFQIDSTRPKIRVVTPAADTAVAAESVSLSGCCEPDSTISLFRGGATTALQTVPVDAQGKFLLSANLEPGWNELLLRAQDLAGNTGDAKIRLFSDREPPLVHLELIDGKDNLGNVDGATLTHSKGRLQIEASDDGGLAECKVTVDGRPRRLPLGEAKDGKVNLTLSLDDLSEGDREIVCVVTDRAGRGNTVKAIFNVDSSEKFGERTLTRGAKGADVQALQDRLVQLKLLDEADVTSVLDAATFAAVKSFQDQQGMKSDGVVGRATLSALGPRIFVNLAACSLVLDRPGQPLVRFPVAVGMSAYPTPTGGFTIVYKEKNPTWLPPDSAWAKEAKSIPPGPGNPLGTRWIGLDSGTVGIHGTNAEYSIGTHASHGCIRMYVRDVESLYEMVETGTTVTILAGTENLETRKKYWP